MKQSFRIWAFLTILSATFLVLGQLIGGRQGLLIGFILALSLNFYLFFAGDKRILKFFKTEELKGQDPWGLVSLTDQLATKLRIPTPKVFIMDSITPTAFSIGRTWGGSKIIFSTGLLDKFNQEELKAVLMLQLIHIQKLHTMTSGIGGQLAELLFLGAQGLDSFIDFADIFSKRTKPSSFFQNLINPLGTMLIRMNIGPKGFLDTDLAAATVLGNKITLAEVLWKLHSYATTLPLEAPPGAAPLFVVNPLTHKGLSRYFESHPTIERRIENLVGSYPL